MEASARATLPAVREETVGDWVIRLSGGATKRVNSANPTRPGARLDDVRAAAEAVYLEAGLPARFRLNPLAADGTDAALAALGYESIDASWTMAAPLDAASSDAPVLFAKPDAAWSAAHATASGWNEAACEAHAASLARLPPVATAATLVERGRPIGFAVVGIALGCAQIFDVVIAADRRGAGQGDRLMRALLDWARANGATRAALQVLASNDAARRLYARLGFADAYPYHYRVRR